MSLIYHLYRFPPPQTPINAQLKRPNSKCSFPSGHPFPLLCSRAVHGNSTTSTALLFQQPVACQSPSRLSAQPGACSENPTLHTRMGVQLGLRATSGVPQREQWEVSRKQGTLRLALSSVASVDCLQNSEMVPRCWDLTSVLQAIHSPDPFPCGQNSPAQGGHLSWLGQPCSLLGIPVSI